MFGPFEKCFHKCTVWRAPRALISFSLYKHIFLNFCCHGDWFYNRDINKATKTKFLDDNGSGVKPTPSKNRNKTFPQLQFKRRSVVKRL